MYNGEKLYLDDIRNPDDDLHFVVVRNYDEFVKYFETKGCPSVVSFDHDLASEHYAPEENWDGSYNEWAAKREFKEKTGYICAEYLIEFCVDNNIPVPPCYIHSMNPVGAENIKRLIDGHNKKMGHKNYCVKKLWNVQKMRK